MTIAHLLEDFGTLQKGSVVELTDVMLEEKRLEAFEQGYQAGWDDSVKATNDHSSQVSSNLAQSLNELSFTYHEACGGVLNGLRPLIEQMVQAILPTLGKETLGPKISEVMADALKEFGSVPVELVTATGQSESLAVMLDNDVGMPFTVIEDANLSALEVHLRFGDVREQQIDMQAMVNSISKMVEDFFETQLQQQKETA